jgi:hypothetical protein
MTDPRLWRYYAEEHGECLVDFMSTNAPMGLLVEQTRIAAHFGRLWLAWLDAAEADIPCANCSDKYTPEGTERGETFDIEDVVD